MRATLIVFLLLCAMGLGAVFMTGCAKDDKSSLNPATGLLLMNSGEKYFPEIPKGVAR